jgi:hypothetical protein
MKKRIILFVVIIFSAFTNIAQQIPVGSCGIVCVYDAAGNRTKRIYFCNNGIDPYPTVPNKPKNNSEETAASIEIQQVDALYPNPTSGRFFITFSNTLSNASISI